MPASTKEPKPKPEVIDCFATDEVKTMHLKGTRFWVEVKRHLDAGEQSDIDEAYFESISFEDQQAAAASGRKMYVSFSKQRFLKLATFVSDWNLCDATGKTVRLPDDLRERIAVMRRLSAPMAALITAAVDEVAAEEIKALEADPEDDANPTPAGDGTG